MDSALLMRRLHGVAIAFTLLTAGMVTLLYFAPMQSGLRSLRIGQNSQDAADEPGSGEGTGRIPSCQTTRHRGSTKVWEAAQAKYSKLRDDKFTISLQTYRREKELSETLDKLLEKEIPSLQEIVVSWVDTEAAPPDDFVSERGIPVRYRRAERNSLNEKLRPDPSFQTQAVLLSDDDVYYHPDDLEFVFQAWRKFGRYRMTGALARCALPQADGKWRYDFCSTERDGYSMILTNLAFSHISFLDYYSSDDLATKRTREYVDEHFNCEDIAFNYVASLLTGDGPLLVTGNDRYVNMEPLQGLSRKPNHVEARSNCLYDLAEIFGCMPLVNETAHIERGVVVL